MADVEIPPTADELQARQAKKLTDDERKTADDAAATAEIAAKKEHHAQRIKDGHAHNAAQANKLWIGLREVTLTREATEDDVGYVNDEPCSVVTFVDTGEERVVLDRTIQTTPTGPVIFSH